MNWHALHLSEGLYLVLLSIGIGVSTCIGNHMGILLNAITIVLSQFVVLTFLLFCIDDVKKHVDFVTLFFKFYLFLSCSIILCALGNELKATSTDEENVSVISQ